MPAVRSNNRTNVFINQNFIIQVKEYQGVRLAPDANGIDQPVDRYSKSKLTSANKIIDYIKNEELKIKLFKEVMEGKKQKYTFKIRKRLIINFYSK